eukprot:6196350-Pleurochrysis_carterae.AAC.4
MSGLSAVVSQCLAAVLGLPRLAQVHIGRGNIAHKTDKTFAFTEVQPIVEGHMVVAPRRCVERSAQLSDAEYLDMWQVARVAQSLAEQWRGASASNILLKDGAAVGQPVPHAHVHVVPRVPGTTDFALNDLVFQTLDAWAPTAELERLGTHVVKLKVQPDSERRDRTQQEMADEAAGYRAEAAKSDSELIPLSWPEHSFSRFSVPAEQVFAVSPTSMTVAFVNLRPLAPGHVLVTPRRIVSRLHELTDAETEDFWRTVRRVQALIEHHFDATASTIGARPNVHESSCFFEGHFTCSARNTAHCMPQVCRMGRTRDSQYRMCTCTSFPLSSRAEWLLQYSRPQSIL